MVCLSNSQDHSALQNASALFRAIPQSSRSTLICIECKSDLVWPDYDRGEVVCRNCGVVQKEYATEVMSSCSSTAAYVHDELQELQTRLRGTMIGWGIYGPGMIDGAGNRLTADQYARSKSSVRFQLRNSSGTSLLNLVKLVEGTIARLHLPKIVGVRAAEIYRRGHAAGIRDPLRRIAAAATYIACRERGIPISIKQIAHPCDIRLLWKTHNRIVFALDLKMPPRDASREVPRMVAAAKLPYNVERGAIMLLGKLSEAKYEKKSRATPLAAAAIYLSSKQNGVKVSKKQIASAAIVNESTVDRYCNLITKAIPNDLQVLASAI